MSDLSRKHFVALVGTTVTAETLAAAPPAADAAPAKAAPPLSSEPEAYTFFTAPEAAFIEAAVDRLIPPDASGPGARAAGVAFYIDQQLVGAYGTAAKMYKQGPWMSDASADFGYQLPLAPQEVFRLGIAATNAYCQKAYQKTFDVLAPAHQDEVLSLLDGAKLAFDSVPAKAFFEMLYENTVEGFFADPLYGGNRDKIGWKLVGFPGAAAAYIGFIGKHNVLYRVNPQSIADLQQAEAALTEMRAPMDEMAVHEQLARRALGVK